MIEPKLLGTFYMGAIKNKSLESFLSTTLRRLINSPNGPRLIKEYPYYIWVDSLEGSLSIFKLLKPHFNRTEMKLVSNTIFFKNEVDINYIKLIL